MADIEHLNEITDPAERAREIGRRLGLIPDFQAKLRAMRQEAVLAMRAQGLSFAQIGKEISLHRNRVQQIAEGRSAGGQGGSKAVEAE